MLKQLLALVVALLICLSSHAIEDDFDLTKDSLSENKPDTVLQSFIDNKKMEVSDYYVYFWKHVRGKMDNQVYSRLSLDTHARKGNLLFEVDAYLQFTSEDQVLDGIFTIPQNRLHRYKYFDVSEMFFEYTYDKFDFYLGKLLTSNKASEIVSIADKYNKESKILYEHIYTEGLWQAKFDYHLSDKNFVTFAFYPFEEQSSRLSNKSRWFPNNDDSVVFPVLVNIKHDYWQGPDQFSYLLKYSGSYEDYDYFITLHYGLGYYQTVFKKAGKSTLRRPIVFDPSAGVVRVIKNWRLYSEAYYQYAKEGVDDDFIQTLLGIEYVDTNFADKLKIDSIKFNFEVTKEFKLRNFNSRKTITPSRREHITANLFAAKWKFLINNQLTFNVIGAYDHEYGGLLFSPVLEYQFNDYLSFIVKQTFYHNYKNDSVFALWEDNSNLMIKGAINF